MSGVFRHPWRRPPQSKPRWAPGTPAPVSGTVAATQDHNTSAISGTHTAPPVDGTVASTQDHNTSAITGTAVPPPISGTVAATQAHNTSAISGAYGPTGAVSATQEPNTAAISGTSLEGPITGVVVVVQDDNGAVIVGITYHTPHEGGQVGGAREPGQVARSSRDFPHLSPGSRKPRVLSPAGVPNVEDEEGSPHVE